MKVSYNWLKELANFTYSAQELDEVLTDTGLEVESIEKIEAIPGGLKGVIVGHVLSCEKHPDADKLKVTTVDVGLETTLNIVCGAPNVAVGQKVVVATVGSELFPLEGDSFKIKKSKIRGVESEGMLCAEDELGLGVSHAGIIVLNDDAIIGTPYASMIDAEDDFAIEIGLTPNRADAMGHIGVVRDIAAYSLEHSQVKLSICEPVLIDNLPSKQAKIKVLIENKEACKRYCSVEISNVKIDQSPEWLKQKLRVVGLTPINNVVDITNYVMRELGTPLHAFDGEYVGSEVKIRLARNGEKITTLDGIERELTDSQLVIANEKEAMCIAGVFGGIHSGVSEKTTSLFLEAAYFDAVSVRKTAKFHGLNTDASFRFERGVDVNMVPFGLHKAAKMICDIAGGTLNFAPQDLYEVPIIPGIIDFDLVAANKLMGIKLTLENSKQILESLDFKVLSENGTNLRLEVPSYRVDVIRQADVVEELLRIYGFNRVEIPAKLNSFINQFDLLSPSKVQQIITEKLVSNGAFELVNNSLTNGAFIEKFGGTTLHVAENVTILNPLSSELDVMRQSLLFQTLQTIEFNQNRQNADLKLFEFGKVYSKKEGVYSERKCLFIAVTGNKMQQSWNQNSEKSSFFTLKGLVQLIAERLGLVQFLSEEKSANSILQNAVNLNVLQTRIGEIGCVSKSLLKHFGIKKDVFVAELWFDEIISCLKMNKTVFKSLPKTFAVRRDFSMLVDSTVNYESIVAIAKKNGKKLLKEVSLFDVYEGDTLPDGKKSYAVAFYLQDLENTLTDAQIEGTMAAIQQKLEQELGVQLRS